MKRVLALAAVMVMALCGVALAAAADNVNVTVNVITKGNTLKLYKIAGASVAANNSLQYEMTTAITLPAAYDTIDEIAAVTGSGVTTMANAFGAAFAGVTATYSGNAGDTESVTLAVAPGYYYGIVEGTANAGIVYKPMLINAVPVANTATIVGAEAITDAKGYVSWEGLKAGTYYVIETGAPAGYRLDTTPHEVVLSKTAATLDNPMTDAKDEEYYNKVEVPNTPGASLPSTGGIGTTIFYVAGLIMVVGAATILIARRKADAE